MRSLSSLLLLAMIMAPISSPAQDSVKRVQKAAAQSTLNQPGTHPFHLLATIAPTRPRDLASNRTGTVEIWWQSPTHWRRELHSPTFQQIQLVDGDHLSQHNDGDYLPYWLANIANELIEPLPALPLALQHVSAADSRTLMGSTYYQWSDMSSNGIVAKGMGATVALNNTTGLLFYDGSTGYGALFADYLPFHNRIVARTVSAGTPEVTAKVTTLEDLKPTSPSLLDAPLPAPDPQPIRTVILDELVLRKSLIPQPPIVFPPLKDGPLEGVLTTQIVVDRTGHVRETSTIVSDNPGTAEAARAGINALRFQPILQDGVPIQVVSRFTLAFKTTRPSGTP